MSWLIVIEENQGLSDQVTEALALIDPKAIVLPFADSRSFLAWMEQVKAKAPHLEPALPADKFLGIVTSIESWKFKDVKLIGKFKALFVQMGFAPTEEEIFVLFTAYEVPTFQIKRFEYRSVTNVIFKPFDKLVLQQALDVAFKGCKALDNKISHTSKSQAQIEMLKEIKITALSELGFQTLSNQKLEVGAIAKYYADFLETRQHKSALAQVLSFDQPAGKELGVVELKFFALDQTQSFNLQKASRSSQAKRSMELAHAASNAYEFLFVKHEGSSLCSEVMPTFERFFEHKVTDVPSLQDANEWMTQAPADGTKRFVLIDHAEVIGDEVGLIEKMRALHPDKNLVVAVLSPRILPEELEWALSKICEDIFYSPFNKSYIVKSFKRKWRDLRSREELFESRHELEQNVFVSNQVKMVEVSEAGLVIEYHREIHLGSFRDFHFTMANETEVPPIVAQCNFNAPSSEKGKFLCHFVFFGMRDHELKFIRRWMLNQYVAEKLKSEG
jgi:hypothetical protein